MSAIEQELRLLDICIQYGIIFQARCVSDRADKQQLDFKGIIIGQDKAPNSTNTDTLKWSEVRTE